MKTKVKESLIEINDISRQILSRIQEVHEDVQEDNLKRTLTEADSDSTSSNPPMKTELSILLANRNILITQLFEHFTLQKIKEQPILLDELTSLDAELSQRSQLCKDALAAQVIKLKKSKKVANSYKKY